jgi:hypothetical protein
MIDLKEKESFLFLFFFFVIIAFVSISLVIGDEANLGCSDIADCSGTASCGSSGKYTGCTIKCANRAVIVCPPPI